MNQANSQFNMLSISFLAQTQYWHINTLSHIHHQALGTFYEKTSSLIDKFGEVSVRLFGAMDEAKLAVSYSNPSNAVNGLESYKLLVADYRAMLLLEGHAAASSILDDIVNQIDHTIFCMTRFS